MWAVGFRDHVTDNQFFDESWKWKSLSCVPLFATLWTVQSMEFSRPEYWSGQPFPSPGDLPNPGIEPRTPTLQVASLPAEPQGKPKNTGVGSLSLLQGIFPTQAYPESNTQHIAIFPNLTTKFCQICDNVYTSQVHNGVWNKLSIHCFFYIFKMLLGLCIISNHSYHDLCSVVSNSLWP